jgi:hypothetical protein
VTRLVVIRFIAEKRSQGKSVSQASRRQTMRRIINTGPPKRGHSFSCVVFRQPKVPANRTKPTGKRFGNYLGVLVPAIGEGIRFVARFRVETGVAERRSRRVPSAERGSESGNRPAKDSKSLQVRLPDRGERAQGGFGPALRIEETAVGEIVRQAVAKLVPNDASHRRLR